MGVRGEVGKLNALQLRVGDHVAGKFRIERELASGGAGVVVEASHVSLGKRVALKLLFPGHHPRRFWREARAAASLTTPHSVQIIDEGEHAGIRFIVMELLEGEDLHSVLRDRGKLSVQDAVDCLLQVCHALAHAHRRGIVHRDIKPANLFLLRGGGASPKVKLLDFSHAKVADAHEALTNDGDHMGTFEYMSPEQYDDPRAVTHATDLWALGVLLFELIAGRRPFFDPLGNRWDELARIRTAVAPSIRTLAPETPEDLAALIDDALQKDAGERTRRIPDVGAYAARLAAFASSNAARLNDDIQEVLADRPSTVPKGPSGLADGGATASTTLRSHEPVGPGIRGLRVGPDSDPILSVDGAATTDMPRPPQTTSRRAAVPAVLAGVALTAAVMIVGPGQRAHQTETWPPPTAHAVPAALGQAHATPSVNIDRSPTETLSEPLSPATRSSQTGATSGTTRAKSVRGAAAAATPPGRTRPATSTQASSTAPQASPTAWLNILLDARRPTEQKGSSSAPDSQTAAEQ